MMAQNKGASAEPTGLGAPEGAEPHSRLVASPAIPSAVTIPGELYAFLMGEGPLEGVWFGEMNEGFRGAFWWRALLRCAAGWPASAIEARSGETVKLGSTEGESAVGATSAETPAPSSPRRG